MTHFTYEEKPNLSALQQGDILDKTDELMEVINAYHPHYGNDGYTHFQVLTQSCDLVRRGKEKTCSSRYITIAAVRRLDLVIYRLLSEDVGPQKAISNGDSFICNGKEKPRVQSFLESLFNNNDKKHFFLKACPEKGLNNDSCTFLSLAITIRAHEHYEKCLKAKKIQLESNFQSKLGWLVGNLYSRVGTEDYSDQFSKREEFVSHIENVMNGHVLWIEPHNFQFFKKFKSENPDKSVTELAQEAAIEKKRVTNDKIVTIADKIYRSLELDDHDHLRKKIENFLKSSKGQAFLSDDLKLP
ncbi:hypothetical protein [Methylophaga sp. UBA2689]|uniref:hypothetical protein n=1 Tax=Methylophaga sp. UBA2689 TaxID=1946878 RepID=UPI0025FF5E2C|nr:hypothetical protein [Methylophaga sp. UBA2689]|tara:strand:+ start:641 stop:1540 length:900 start_codon:yes stop_codon:yes gene_type:complete